MLPKLDEYGQPLTGNKGMKQERHKLEVFQEFYVEDNSAMIDIIKEFAINADNFDYELFMSASTPE
jgi:hypothetical protein